MRNILEKAKTLGKTAHKKATVFMTTAYAVMNNMRLDAYASNTTTTGDGSIGNMNASDVFTGLLKVISSIGQYVGAMAVAGGIFMYLQAKKDDNPNAESKAQMAIAVGLAFFILPQLLGTIFNITLT